MYVTNEVDTPNFPNYLEVAQIDKISISKLKEYREGGLLELLFRQIRGEYRYTDTYIHRYIDTYIRI
jgi:hypothetical protein